MQLSCILRRRKRARVANSPAKGAITGISKAIDHLQLLTKSDNIGARPSLETLNARQGRRQASSESIQRENWRRELRGICGIFEALQLLKRELPKPDWAGFNATRIATESMTDGQIYSLTKIEDADATARSFHSTWTSISQASLQAKRNSLPKADVVINLARICLVLKTMDRGDDFLKNFCDYYNANGHNLELPLGQDTLSEILPAMPRETRLFEAEQYRVVRRDYLEEWSTTKRPVRLAQGEPLPFWTSGRPFDGSFANVTIWHHVDVQQKCYAIKEAKKPQLNKYIRSEMGVLTQIKPHDHVIRLVYVLERQDKLLLVLEPAASNDLSDFLASYRKNHENPQPGVDLRHERHVLQTAFGCLSHGLRHIHTNIRHKDIKLDNILYVKESDRGARLVFADFGIAHYYGSGNASSTENPWHFARKCAAPEVLEDDHEYMRRRAHHLHRSRHENNNHGGPGSPHASHQPGKNRPTHVHDTKSDTFSLGACFMDILSALVKQPLPKPPEIPETEFIFAEHLKPILTWASDHEDRQTTSGLKAAFRVARGMLQYNKRDRWNLDKVIKHLATPEAGGHMFCTSDCKRKALSLIQDSLNDVEEDEEQNQGEVDAIVEEDSQDENPTAGAKHDTSNPTPNGQSNGHVSPLAAPTPAQRELQARPEKPEMAVQARGQELFTKFQSNGNVIVSDYNIIPKNSS